LALLKAHKSHQAEVKIRNRQHYRDHGLIFLAYSILARGFLTGKYSKGFDEALSERAR